MSTPNNIVNGLNFLQKISSQNEKPLNIAVEHDKIWAGSDGDYDSMSEDNRLLMDSWGWEYEEDEGWWCFV